ncbi:MAG: 2-oxoacid:acceptor oxidoreductase family protein [bacterium]|nr:oxidoreductase [Planctomycetota bacterium]HIL52262.1 oxidoreductase [Planctomycetota bacterium]
MGTTLQTIKYPGIRITTNGNQLVAYYTQARIADAGVFYPITPSTEMGENFQLAFAEGKLNVFGETKIAIETEGEHAAQGGAIAISVTGKRVVNFTSGQGIVYALEQYYHAPGKFSTMVIEVAARALTKHALNVHCGHDDIYAALDTGWTMLFAKDSQQAADQSLILRRVCELSLNPGMNIQDGFLTSHLERTFLKHESSLLREYLGAPGDTIECPTEAQRTLFGPTRRRIPKMIDLKNPLLLGPVHNQEHYMNGVIARRNNFAEPILGFLEEAFAAFGELTGRYYGLLSEYRCEDAQTVFLSMGSAAENIEAAVDDLREREGAAVGSIHLNVIRPFPEAALIEALRGKRTVIVLERTDEALAGNNPLAREVRAGLSKALENQNGTAHKDLPSLTPEETPRVFGGAYGLGSRDFRPEGVLGAYEFVEGRITRQDGQAALDGTSYFVLGIDHPYAVESKHTPSLLPEGAIAVRLHSIGGWGMITTGKNLGEIVGAFGETLSEAKNELDEFGRLREQIHISANPKYGSEKKGAPTAYFLVVAPERVRVNCDLRHVNVVLCCDPKAFTHSNPLDGLAEGGTFVWESDEAPDVAWTRIPKRFRQEIIDKKLRIFTLPGFDIARAATSRPELQLRMQGNAFLGAFFAVSPFLDKFDIDQERFHEVVRAQYQKKFGRFGEAVVESNMTVMTEGFARIREVSFGDLEAQDASSMRGLPMLPCGTCESTQTCETPAEQSERPALMRTETFDQEFRAGLGYFQPASVLSSVGLMAAATGATASKYVARRETPLWIAENCTQCMECITACPDTALPNSAQDLGTILRTAILGYSADAGHRSALVAALPELETAVRSRMQAVVTAKGTDSFLSCVEPSVREIEGLPKEAQDGLIAVFETIPVAFQKVPLIFASLERKNPGAGGVFQIMVSDLCKGCGECVVECGDNDALVMRSETVELNAEHQSGTAFLDLLPDTPQKYLGRFDPLNLEESHQNTLRNHLMLRSKYEALVSGDGACAGCGEKSVLRAIASMTEAYMRPLYHAKAERLRSKAALLEEHGTGRLADLKEQAPEEYDRYKLAVAHLICGLGGEDADDTAARIAAQGDISDTDLIKALTTVMRQDAFNHRDLQAVDGRLDNGMSVMAMGAHTGCNTVYGSTPANNPHPYPWMNSLFQDGVTVTWLFGESFIMDNARRSVIPERLSNALLDSATSTMDEARFYELTHFHDIGMTDLEVAELPKAWAVGGDGGMGDIGFQNLSKVMLQNRPNVKILLLDTQVYSNTGGQNSDSTPMLGGGDMNQFGAMSQGKLTEKKNIAEIFLGGHGSPFVAQVSLANAPKFFKALLDGLAYRGTALFQCFTTCQPEHGVGDDMSTVQASRARDSRGMPEFVFDPRGGEVYQDTMDLKGNPSLSRDWAEIKVPGTKLKRRFTIAHWAATEARFRRHLKPAKGAESAISLDAIMLLLTQEDITYRRFLDPEHRSFVPDFGVSIEVADGKGGFKTMLISRQLVLFCIERRRAWRMLQSKAGIVNQDYHAQRALLAKHTASELSIEDLRERGLELFEAEREALTAK